MFVKCFLLLIVSCLVARTYAASPTMTPTVGKYDFQLANIRAVPGVAVGPDLSAIYLIGGDEDYVAAILKCPTDSINRFDCTQYMKSDDKFYTSSTLKTKSTTVLDDIEVYGNGYTYNGELYFLDESGSTDSIYKCVGVSQCFKYIDLSAYATDPRDYIMTSSGPSGKFYIQDGSSGDYFECTGTSTSSLQCTTIFTTASGSHMAIDPTEEYIYFFENNNVMKGKIANGATTVYLDSSTVIGKDLSGSNVQPSFNWNYGIGVDSSGNVYVHTQSCIYKCTAVDTCSLYYTWSAFGPYADDDPTAIFYVSGIKFDSKGFMYLTSNNGVHRVGPGAWSAGSGSTLNSKMYGIIVLAIFPFAAFFACGYFFAKHRLGYTKAPTKETEMSQVSHTAV